MVGTNWLGPHGNVLHYPVRRGELMNFVSMSERDDWQVESWSTAGEQARSLRNDFRGWHADVQLMIDADRNAVQMGDDDPRADGDAGRKGRITLLGDACHPTLPFLGQGGVMSIEDGYVAGGLSRQIFRRAGTSPSPATRTSARTGPRWSFARPAKTRRAPSSRALADKDAGRRRGRARMAAGPAQRADGLVVQLRRHGDRDLTIRDNHSPPACCGRHRLSRFSSICTIAVIASDSAANTIRPENTTST